MSNKIKLKTSHAFVKSAEDKLPDSKEVSTDTEKNSEEENNIFNPEGELVIDVFETNSDFVVLTAIAGVHIKDLDISVEKDMMVIKGQRTDPHDNPEKKYFYQECYWGPFSRKIILPENINTKEAQAQMDKGVLTIKIPKIIDEGSLASTQVKKEPVKLS